MSIDYTSYSNNDVVTTGQMSMVDDAIDSTVEDFEKIIEVAETETDSEETEDIMLKVANCEKCYIREKADKNSPYIAIVSNNDDLLVNGASDIDNNGDLWNNVCTESGAEGYIMSKFTNYNE